MIRFKIFLLLLTFSTSLVFLSCAKNDYDNPKVDGNLVKARVDGKDWVAMTQAFSGEPVIMGYNNNYVTIVAHNTKSGWNTEMKFNVKDVTGPGEYKLRSQNNPGRGAWKDNTKTDNWFFTNDEGNEGIFVVTEFNQESKIIKGTFSFDAKNEGGEIVRVRDGVFDITY
jgi:hypothetical protein